MTPSASPYNRKGGIVGSRECAQGNISLRQRRQSSEVVYRQLQHWRIKSNTQESLLQDLERCNRKTRLAAAAKVDSDLRQIAYDGRALVRNWPSSFATAKQRTSTLPTTRKNQSTSAEADENTTASRHHCSSNRKESAGEESDKCSRSKSCAFCLATDIQCNELYSPHHPASFTSKFPTVLSSSAAQGKTNIYNNSDVPTEGRALLRKVGEGAQCDSSNNTGNALVSAAQPSGWFWGAGGCNPGGGSCGDVGIIRRGGGIVDIEVAVPGEGTIATFWRGRGMAAQVKDAPNHGGIATLSAAGAAATATASSTIHSNEHRFSRQASCIDNTTGINRNGGGQPLEESWNWSSNSSKRTLICVASAKAAVRSASNRAAELSRLLSKGNNPPREECLDKAESAVRAAQSAISCANERLFQLELMAVVAASQRTTTEHSAKKSRDAEGYQHKLKSKYGGVDADTTSGVLTNFGKRSDKHDYSSATGSFSSSSSLLVRIEQLTEQLELAQSLQAASLTARARLTRRFALEDTAVIRLQALSRGCVARWRERCSDARLRSKTAGQERTRLTEKTLWRESAPEPMVAIGGKKNVVASMYAAPGSSLSQGSGAQALPPPRGSSSVAILPQEEGLGCGEQEGKQEGHEEDDTEAMLLRKEGLWWTLAEAESVDEVDEPEYVLLRAVVRLQAIVRSRLARSRIIAEVNARFVEHFDEENQHPFYVCSETNSSQWARPFGFGFGGGRKIDLLSRVVVGGGLSTFVVPVGGVEEDEDLGDNGKNAATYGGVVLERTSRETLCEQQAANAAVAIQCAWRAAKARGQLAEKIIRASL